MEEYLVLLYSHDDLDAFYADMETEGGILNRAVDCQCRRPMSRTTMYTLTADEAVTVKTDSRVRAVARVADIPEEKPLAFTRTNFVYDKSTTSGSDGTNSSNSKAWATWRHRNTYADNSTDIDNWYGYLASSSAQEYTGSESFTETGKNVDILIRDGHPDPSMPDLQVNVDGTGGSRVNEIDWDQYTATVQGNPTEYNNPTTNSLYYLRQAYQYSPYNSGSSTINSQRQHGASVTTNAAGSTLGFAINANIYSFDPYTQSQRDYGNYDATSGSPFYSSIDYVRAWHNSKSINPDTGCKNPTVMNCSTGFTANYSEAGGSWPVQATTRGVTYGDGVNPMSNADIEAAGIKAAPFTNRFLSTEIAGVSPNRTFSLPLGDDDNGNILPFFISDIEDCINDGIHVVISAGNDLTVMAYPGSSEYTGTSMTLANGDVIKYKARSFASDDAILVGCLSGESRSRAGGASGQGECRVEYSNMGLGVDFYTFGAGNTSGYNGTGGDVSDPRNASYDLRQFNGTSCAAPLLTGMIACILERYPDMTPAKMKEYLTAISRGETEGECGDLGTGFPNVYSFDTLETPKVPMLLKDIRPQFGRIETKINHSVRPTSGATYPRQRTARTFRTKV